MINSKIFTIALVTIGCLVETYWYLNKQSENSSIKPRKLSTDTSPLNNESSNSANNRYVKRDLEKSGGLGSMEDPDMDSLDMEENEVTEVERAKLDVVAQENYQSFADAALKGDTDVLKKFTKLDPSCKWCDKFYDQLYTSVQNPDLNPKQRSAFARSLANSGRVENVQRLVDTIHDASARREPVGDYTEAIAHITDPDSENEQNVNNDGTTTPPEIVDILTQQLNDPNPYLQQAAVSALTKDGSLKAVNTLYEHSLEKADVDGYYSEHMGIGTMKPKPEAVGRLEELAAARNGFSHLAVKALLNYGPDGLSKVISILNSSPDPEFDQKMMSGAVDRVKLDKATVKALEGLTNSAQPALRNFANQVMDEQKTQIAFINKKLEYGWDFESGAAPPE